MCALWLLKGDLDWHAVVYGLAHASSRRNDSSSPSHLSKPNVSSFAAVTAHRPVERTSAITLERTGDAYLELHVSSPIPSLDQAREVSSLISPDIYYQRL